MHHWNWDSWGGHMMWWVWIPVLILIVWMVIRMLDRSNTSTPSTHSDSPLDILKKRFAKGEISKEEYERSKKVLLEDS